MFKAKRFYFTSNKGSVHFWAQIHIFSREWASEKIKRICPDVLVSKIASPYTGPLLLPTHRMALPEALTSDIIDFIYAGTHCMWLILLVAQVYLMHTFPWWPKFIWTKTLSEDKPVWQKWIAFLATSVGCKWQVHLIVLHTDSMSVLQRNGSYIKYCPILRRSLPLKPASNRLEYYFSFQSVDHTFHYGTSCNTAHCIWQYYRGPSTSQQSLVMSFL